ncbi:MAG: hypothetical protein ABIZ56_02350 [Chthoniobacteraceae bacterium]
MKLFTLPAAVAGLLAVSAVSVQASFHDSPVRLEVKVNGGDSHDRIKGSTAVQHDQTKELEITVSSVSKTPPSGLRLKWFIYGRDLKSNSVSVLRSGEAKVALGGNGSQVISSAKVETKSTPEHSVVSRGRGRGNRGTGGGSRVSVKKVEATGDKYIGYGVQVLDGGKVVAEAFDPAGVKGSVSSKSPSSSN